MFQRIVFMMLVLATGFAHAADVKLKYQDLNLNGNLVLAEGKKISDGIILMTHGTIAHGKMEIMSSMQQFFKDRGLSSLSITLSLGLDNRSGMYDCNTPHKHKHTDAVDEIGAWLSWLKQKGANSVVLFGHSRGGNQTARFASKHDDPAIKAVILVAPMTWDEEKEAKEYKKKYGKDLSEVLAKAQAMVKAGRGKEMMDNTSVLYCKDTRVTAESFISYHQPDPRMDTPSLLSSIPKPVIVFAGSEDQVVKNLPEKVKPLADGKKVQFRVIEGAGHFFRDLNGEDMADAIVEFLEGLNS